MQGQAGVSLLFAAGARPRAVVIERLLDGSDDVGSPARVSHRPPGEPGWLELLAGGLTFDLRGLAPGAPAPLPIAGHRYGLIGDFDEATLEVLSLAPGAHIAAGGALMPVVRTLVRVAAALVMELPVMAVCWEPAQAWMDPKYFSRIMFSWLSGGSFPALGLTALRHRADGAVESTGLGFFIGQELCLARREGEAAAETMKLAARMIDRLVALGGLDRPEAFSTHEGETLRVQPSADGRRIEVQRSA